MTGLLFLLFFAFMLLGVPVALAIGASTLLALNAQGVPLMVVTQQMFQDQLLCTGRRSNVHPGRRPDGPGQGK